LRRAKWNVTVARDAMQAVMFAVRTPPDVIVLDITMPGGNGLSALQKLKASEKTRHVPVLVVSGEINPALPAKVVELGAAEFGPKPGDIATLPSRVRDAVEAARVMRERVFDAVGRLALGAGTDAASVRDFVAREHKAEHPMIAIEGALDQLRTQRKLVKQQNRWFLA